MVCVTWSGFWQNRSCILKIRIHIFLVPEFVACKYAWQRSCCHAYFLVVPFVFCLDFAHCDQFSFRHRHAIRADSRYVVTYRFSRKLCSGWETSEGLWVALLFSRHSDAIFGSRCNQSDILYCQYRGGLMWASTFCSRILGHSHH